MFGSTEHKFKDVTGYGEKGAKAAQLASYSTVKAAAELDPHPSKTSACLPHFLFLQTITFFEEGEPLVDGEPGDLQFVIRTVANENWERRGHDLLINQTITLVDALTGGPLWVI